MNSVETKSVELEVLKKENLTLRQENQRLSDTVNWMHELIWQLIKKVPTSIKNGS